MRKRARSPSTSSSGEFTPESASFSAPSESSTEESNEGHQRKIRGSLPRHYRLNQRPVNKSASNGVAVKPLFPAVSMTQLRQHWERDRQLKIAAREVAASKRALQQYLKGMRLRPLTEPEEVTDVKIEKKMIYVGAAQERKKFLTYIPTAVTVREYDDATIRSYVVPEDEHEDSCWNANLTNWNHDKDKSYQNKLSFARYIKSQHPSKMGDIQILPSFFVVYAAFSAAPPIYPQTNHKNSRR
ncbi:hypothetical protein DFJ77DRAFT_507951 [Powellomyces hirtus]|nr:hypothetical protein DFJ77DRAFT_507951 [Powellomyces hirtus]